MTQIRPLDRGDFEAWSDLWRAYLAYYETTRPDDIYRVYFDRLLGDDPRDYNGLIALQDNQPVGLAHYLFHRHGWNIADTCYLQDLYATPETRGTGVGRALIEAVYAKADANGTPDVYWTTQDFNVTARRLYDRVAAKTPFIKYARN